VSVGAATGVTMALFGFGVWSLVAQQASMGVVQAIWAWSLVRWRPRKFPKIDALRDLYAFGLPVLVSQSIRSVSNQWVNVMIARGYSSTDLGYFDRGRLVPQNLTMSISNVLTKVNFPSLARLQGDDEALRRNYLEFFGAGIGFILLSMVALGIFAQETVTILLGSKWLPGVWYMQASCVLGVVHVAYLMNANLLRALGKSNVFFRVNMICAILQFAGVLVGAYWGIRGMVAGDIAARALALFWIAITIKNHSGVSPLEQLRELGVGILWAAGLAVALAFLKLAPISLFPRTGAGVGISIFVGFVWWRSCDLTGTGSRECCTDQRSED
jgi:O-antigen/teichoic acid export membrane protein